jgi:hypothetical protein
MTVSSDHMEISRLEVIDEKGRAYVRLGIDHIVLSWQDGGRTLKVFVTPRGEVEA